MKQLTEQFAQSVVRPRARDTYKGSFGKILIVGGNAHFGGAAIMSASAAVYAGAGLVSVATDPVNRHALHARLPEAMILDATAPELETAVRQATVIVVGPGLGTDGTALTILKTVFAAVNAKQVMIIDGSAITLVASHHLDYPQAQLVWTPHQIEWQRLSGLPWLPKPLKPAKKRPQKYRVSSSRKVPRHMFSLMKMSMKTQPVGRQWPQAALVTR